MSLARFRSETLFGADSSLLSDSPLQLGRLAKLLGYKRSARGRGAMNPCSVLQEA